MDIEEFISSRKARLNEEKARLDDNRRYLCVIKW